MALRRGPEENNRYRPDFIHNKRVFSAGGASANIVSAGKDLSILLSEKEIKEAQENFRNEKIAERCRKNPEEDEAAARAAIEAKPPSFPVRIYRERISEQQGLLLIYLIDTQGVFRQDDLSKDLELGIMMREKGFNPDIPLVGFAFGFPPIASDPGAKYTVGNYAQEEEEEEVDEFDEELQKEEEE